MKFGTFLLAMVEPLIAKILLALGFSAVSIVGVDAVISTIKDQVVSSISSMSADMLNFALYLWVGKALGLLFGAMTTKLMLWSIEKSVQLLGKAPA